MKKGWLLFIALLLMVSTTPVLADDPTSDNTTGVGADPVTGRNEGFSLTWGDPYLATVYEVQIAEDPNFTFIVFHTKTYQPFDVMNPTLVFAPGQLEAGHIYYWRVRVRGTAYGQSILSPWSEPVKFIVGAGLPVSAPYPQPLTLSPLNGALNIPLTPLAFSWTAMFDVIQYQLQLAEDEAMSKLIVDALVPVTAYNYEGNLHYGTSYYWRVRATEPAPSDFSSVSSFTTVAQPQPPPLSAPVTPSPSVPIWVWMVSSLGALLIGATIFLIVRTTKLFKR